MSIVLTLGVLATSELTGKLYVRNKPVLAYISILIAAGVGALFILTADAQLGTWMIGLAVSAATCLGLSLYPLARLFSKDTEEERRVVREFFTKLDTPIDVEKEVYGAGRKQVATLPIVGRTIVFLGILVCFAFLNTMKSTEMIAVSAMITILLGFGGFLWIAGKRTEAREAAAALLAAKAAA